MADREPESVSEYVDEFGERQPVKRRSNLLWWLLGGVAVVCLLVCLGCCGSGFLFMPKMMMTPAEVVKFVPEVMTIDIPPGFEGKFAMKMDNPIFRMRMASFEHHSGKGWLDVVQMDMKIAGNNDSPEEMRRGFQQGLNSQSGGGREQHHLDPLDMPEVEEVERQIGGQPVKVLIRSGESLSSKRQLKQVEMMLPEKKGFRTLQLQLEESEWDEEAMRKMINSIQ